MNRSATQTRGLEDNNLETLRPNRSNLPASRDYYGHERAKNTGNETTNKKCSRTVMFSHKVAHTKTIEHPTNHFSN